MSGSKLVPNLGAQGLRLTCQRPCAPPRVSLARPAPSGQDGCDNNNGKGGYMYKAAVMLALFALAPAVGMADTEPTYFGVGYVSGDFDVLFFVFCFVVVG